MIRTRILSVAMFLACAPADAAAPPGRGVKEGFRVYSVSQRCRSARVLGVYASPQEAFASAAQQGKEGYIEVTTGSEGDTQTLPQTPALIHVYARACSRSFWQRRGIYGDAAKAQEAVEAMGKTGLQVEVVRDYAPKAVYHVYSQPTCRYVVGKRLRLLGTYVTVGEACEAAKEFRARDIPRVEVTTGAKGAEYFDGTPTRFEVVLSGCKANWSVALATDDGKKANEAVAARTKEDANRPVELVRHYGPTASGVFDGEKAQLPPKTVAGGVEATAALLKSCSDHNEGTAADIAAALKGDHLRLAFAEPREFEVDGKKVQVSEIVVVLPVYTSVLWVRSGDKVFRETKFDPKKWAAFRAWLDSARAAG